MLTLRQETASRDSSTAGEDSPVLGTRSYSLEEEGFDVVCGAALDCVVDAVPVAGPPEISEE